MTGACIEVMRLPIRDTELCVEVRSQGGPPLVLLHGGLSTPAVDWSQQLTQLECRFSVFAIEQRGHGRSGLGSLPAVPGVLASDAIAVMDKLGLADAHVMGFSMGATAALQIACLTPERLLSLVVVGPQFATPPTSEHVRAFTEEAGAWRERLEPLHPEGRWGVLLSQLTGWVETEIPGLPALRRLEAPTLLIHGDRDPFVSPTDLAALAQALPAGELLVVPNARHAAQIDGSEIVNPALTRFWEGRSVRGYG